MSDKTEKYILADEDGDEIELRLVRGHCSCGMPSCAENEWQIYEDGECEGGSTLFDNFTNIILGLIDGSLTPKELDNE